MGRSNGMQLVQDRSQLKRTLPAGPQGLAGWVVDRLRSWRGVREAQGKQMQLVETLPLGGKRQLMLVRCAGEMFLVGGGMESVETIVPIKGEASLSAAAKDLDETCE